MGRRSTWLRDLSPIAGACVLGLAGAGAQAADAIYTQSNATQFGARQAVAGAGKAVQSTAAQMEAYEQMQSQMWGLSIDDVRRAGLLMQGPRGAFSVANITPVEVLGIHARSDAERQKYAELFARILHADTERVLAWTLAHAQAMARLYPNEPVIDFSGSPRPIVDPAIAEAALVPQSAIAHARPVAHNYKPKPGSAQP